MKPVRQPGGLYFSLVQAINDKQLSDIRGREIVAHPLDTVVKKLRQPGDFRIIDRQSGFTKSLQYGQLFEHQS